MTLEKAKEILYLRVKGCNPYLSHDTDNASELGIEAMREVERLRSCKAFRVRKLLPGETTE